jgi:hypothetical protein
MERLYFNKINGEWMPRMLPLIPAEVIKTEVKWAVDKIRCRRPRVEREPWENFPRYYTGPKRVRYEQAVQSLIADPFDLRKDSKVDTFIKFEKALKETSPRLIQPRSFRFNVVIGVYLKQLEKRVFTRINRCFGGEVVMSGYNAAQVGGYVRAMWDRVDNPVTFDFDVSRFDQKCSAIVQSAIEHEVYCSFYGESEAWDLRELLEAQLHTRGSARCADGRVVYSVHGCRMSGDMQTKMGNTLLVCVLVMSWLRRKKVDLRKIGFVDVGDDGQLIVPGGLVDHIRDGFQEYFRIFGFDVKVGPVSRLFSQIKFCQSHPMRIENEYRMVRSLDALRKDTAFLRSCTPSEYDGWLHSMGVAGRLLSSGVPVYHAWYSSFPVTSNFTALDPESGIARLSRGLIVGDGCITDEARCDFYDAFGITPDEQIAAEKYLASIRMPRWGEILTRDLFGIPSWLAAAGSPL